MASQLPRGQALNQHLVAEARDPEWASWTGGLAGAWQRRIARARGIRMPLAGAVTFVQRFGGLVNLNVHFHIVIPDGVFTAMACGS